MIGLITILFTIVLSGTVFALDYFENVSSDVGYGDGGDISSGQGVTIYVYENPIWVKNITVATPATPFGGDQCCIGLTDWTSGQNFDGTLIGCTDNNNTPVFNFTTPLALNALTNYTVFCNSTTSSTWRRDFKAISAYPINQTKISFIEGYDTTPRTTWAYIIYGLGFSDVDPAAGSGEVVVNITYPNASYHLNKHFWINVTTNISVSDCSINDTRWDLQSFNASNTSWNFQNNTVLSDGTYNVNVTCTNLSELNGSALRTFFIDSNVPGFVINGSNFFTINNKSVISNTTAQAAQFNITFSDNVELYAFNITIKNSSGYTVYNLTNTSLPASSFYYNLIDTADISHAVGGNMTVNVSVWDKHTATAIKDMVIKKGLNTLTYDNVIKITASGAWIADTTKHNDRYDFSFSYPPLITSKQKTFFVESDSPLDYYPTSKYKAHFVDWKNKRWIDFEGAGGDATVVKVNDYKYQVTIEIDSNSVTFNSIGGLNTFTRNYHFVIDNVEPVLTWTFPTTTTPTIPSNQSQLFKLNVTDGYINNTIFFLYNSTKDNVQNITTNELTGGTFEFNATFTGLTDNTYYINASHLDQYNNTGISSTITISNTFIDNCSIPTASMKTINFSIQNITNDIYLQGLSQFFFEYNFTDGVGNNILKNYSSKMDSDNFSFCMFPNQTIFTSDISISYEVGANTYTYFTTDISLTNVTQLIRLYTQDGTTRVTFTVTDFSEQAIESAQIRILKWDIGDNSFKTVEIIETDNDGKATANLILNTVYYKFQVFTDGVLRLTEGPFTLTSTTRTFRISFATNWYDTYDERLGTATDLTFNNVTNNFKYEWATSSGAEVKGCLLVIRRNATRDEIVCDNCTTTASGEVIFTVPVLNDTYIATGSIVTGGTEHVTDNLAHKFVGAVADFFEMDGGRTIGIFMSFMIILTLAFVGIWHPIASVVLLLVGIIGSVAMGLYEFSIFPVGIGLVAIGGLLVYKLSK